MWWRYVSGVLCYNDPTFHPIAVYADLSTSSEPVLSTSIIQPFSLRFALCAMPIEKGNIRNRRHYE